MFLQTECRDPHTADWLEKFSNTTNMLEYHGTGAFNTSRFESWDSFFLDMLERSGETIILSARRRGRGRGGWSKNNPYLQDRWVEFSIDIDPPSLASRIMSVREQLAREWVYDLDIITKFGESVLESYFENRVQQRDDEAYAEGERPEKPDEENIEFVEGGKTGSEKRSMISRDSMTILLDNNSFEEARSSPLRKGSFDLLLLLSTQESIHRVLRNIMSSGVKDKPTYDWLRNFYVDRIHLFDGSGKYGRYDDFIEELLLASPSLQGKGSTMSLIDPVGLAEKIIYMRSQVATEWKQLMTAVPQDHIDLRRKLFTRQITQAQLDAETGSQVHDEGGIYSSDHFQ